MEEIYHQITLNEWAAMKEQLTQDLVGVQQSFIRIGYTLRRIEEDELYKNDGYASIAEFAKKEYGLEASTVSRFIAINKKYSVGGNSDELRPEFMSMGSSKLSEMLSLSDTDLQMIGPETTRQEIRELKTFNKAAAAAAVGTDQGVKNEEEQVKTEEKTEQKSDVEIAPAQLEDQGEEAVRLYFAANPEELREVLETDQATDEDLKEIVNPSGSKTFSSGIWFLIMGETQVRIKNIIKGVYVHTWDWFRRIAAELPWPEMPEKKEPAAEERKKEEPEKLVAKKEAEPKKQEIKKPEEKKNEDKKDQKEIKPDSKEAKEAKPDQNKAEPDQAETKPDLKEEMEAPAAEDRIMPKPVEEQTKELAEEPEDEPEGITRLGFIRQNKMDEEEIARYMAIVLRHMNAIEPEIVYSDFWEMFFSERVDENGDAIEGTQ